MRKLLLATTNPGKIRELKHGLKHLPFELVTPSQANIPKDFQVKETGTTFTANAILKAKAFAQQSGLLTLADDGGLIVEVLNHRPGVYSHRYGKTAKSRNKKLLQEMKNINHRQAHYQAVIALYHPQTKKLNTCQGVTQGRILRQPVGSQGFGYDPLFFSYDLKKPFGQATIKEKNSVSHRGRALAKAIKILRQCTNEKSS
jgi:XTP/dITP diphosphohydrolase